MSPEEEEAVQAELEALQREAMVSHFQHPFERSLIGSQMYLLRQRRNVWLCRMFQSKTPHRQRLLYPRDSKRARSLVSVWPWRLDDTVREESVVQSSRLATKFPTYRVVHYGSQGSKEKVIDVTVCQ
jgi:hypothetical protein